MKQKYTETNRHYTEAQRQNTKTHRKNVYAHYYRPAYGVGVLPCP